MIALLSMSTTMAKPANPLSDVKNGFFFFSSSVTAPLSSHRFLTLSNAQDGLCPG